MKKYTFITGDTIEMDGKVLTRIKRISDGAIGGYIESENNLSHEDDAWVSENAQVYGDARVSGDAQVSGNARVYGGALVYGNARVS